MCIRDRDVAVQAGVGRLEILEKECSQQLLLSLAKFSVDWKLIGFHLDLTRDDLCNFLVNSLIAINLDIILNNHAANKDTSACDLSRSFRMLVPLAKEWENIGLCLGLKDITNSINAFTKTSTASCLRETLKLWL